jgi:Domain of unknown function (DUF4386)
MHPQAIFETSPRALGRIAGVLYLAIILLGIFCEAYVRGTIVVPGDAAATAANIRSMETLWRAGIGAELVLLICALPVTLILYVLLRPVSRDLALLAVFFNLVSVSVEAVSTLELVTALSPAANGGLAAVRAHSHGFALALVFFGVECLILGYLIFRSGYLPKAIGVLMQVAGVAYLVNSFVLLLAPAFSSTVFPLIVGPVLAGEGSLTLWLIVKGVDVERWKLALG